MALALRNPPILTSKHNAYPYQLDAVRAIGELEYAAIFHEQGLGKTKIAIDLVHMWLGRDVVDTVFVITKKMLTRNWVDEVQLHSYLTPRVLSTNRRTNSIALNSPVLIYILNYEVVASNMEMIRAFLKTCRVGAILDESQKIKNPKSGIAACFLDLANLFHRRVIMTGTPVANRPFDIWSQIFFLDGGVSLGKSFATFKATLDLPSDSASVAEYGSHLSKVMTRIRSFSIRHTKHTAGLELPDKTIVSHLVDLAPHQRNIYNSYRDMLRHKMFTDDGKVAIDSADAVLKRLLRLVQCASNPVLVDSTYDEVPSKYTETAKLIEANATSTKLIVWTGFVENAEWLARQLRCYSAAMVHGRMTVRDRNQAIWMFKHDSRCRVLIATPGAAKEGLTLTVASHAVFFDRSFSLDDYIQAQDRIHRISQSKDCFVHNLIARNTIDEWIDLLLNAKHQAAQLTQGDISRAKFETQFSHNLRDALHEILVAA